MYLIKCDPRAKARCRFKSQCCGDDVAYFEPESECDKFNQQVLAPPPTNADRIRAMSDEELCDLLDEWWCMGANNDERLAYADERLAWLQQLAGEEKEGADNA